MIQELYLENFVTFKHQCISFSEKLNIIVGETGSGKSVIFDAISSCLGHRLSRKSIMPGKDFLQTTISFKPGFKKIENSLDELGFPTDEFVIFKRILESGGRSKAYINFNPAKVSHLSESSRKFIDLVGQFENQKLLSSKYQLDLLDDYSEQVKLLLHEYTSKYSEYRSLKEKLEDIRELNEKSFLKKEFIEFQYKELCDANLAPNEDQFLEEKKKNILDFEKNLKKHSSFYAMTSSETELESFLNKILKESSDLKLYSSESEIAEVVSSAHVLKELVLKIQNYEQMSFSEEDVNQVFERLDTIQKLKLKHRVSTVNELNELQQALSEQMGQITGQNELLAELEDEFLKLEKELKKIASKLHEYRSKTAEELSTFITEEVRKLNMQDASFKVELSKTDYLGPKGNTQLKFLVETIPGSGFHPLGDVASGGELSRILLCLRALVSEQGGTAVFLFDEIDTGVGGKTASLIGSKLEKIAKNSQVIAISHLPQIAVYADRLIHVQKHRETSVAINSSEKYSTSTESADLKANSSSTFESEVFSEVGILEGSQIRDFVDEFSRV